MSTTTHTNGPDSMVTVKVTYDGTTRRVKMPLREMVPRVLEEHVRHRLVARPSHLITQPIHHEAERQALHQCCLILLLLSDANMLLIYFASNSLLLPDPRFPTHPYRQKGHG